MKSLKAFKQNNSGAGLVNVIIALTFLSTLGLLILALSYTSSEMKSSERTGREIAYNADGVVEQLRSGLQLAISDSIKDCYNDVMTNYSAYRYSIEDKFDRSFNYSLNNWKPYFINDEGVARYFDADGNETDAVTGIPLFTGTRDFYDSTDSKGYVYTKYDLNALEHFVKAGFGGEADIVCVDNAGNTISDSRGDAVWSYRIDDDGKKVPEKVTLKNIKVRYQRLFHTVTVTTDLVVEFPDLGYVYHEESQDSSFTDFAVVALNEMRHTSGRVVVDGNAYAGKLNISAATNSHSFVLKRGGLLISKGDVDVRGQNSAGDYYDAEKQEWYGRSSVDATLNAITDDTVRERERIKINSAFYVTDGSTLWANGINVFQDGIAALCYRENVLNDLNLMNTGATALITGDAYYGFGNSTTNPAESSSIIANGIKTQRATLNLSGLSNLTLAGYSFIDVGGNANVKMGQSMATKRDQVAYLVPYDMLNYDDFAYKISTNPEVFPAPEAYQLYVEQFEAKGNKPLDSVRLWSINGVDMHPSDYGITVRPVSVPYSGNYTIGYFFMDFTATDDYSAEENANRYFRDYFERNTERVNDYTQQYLNYVDTYSMRTVGDVFGIETDPTKPRITLRAVLKETLGDAYDTFSAYLSLINTEVAKKLNAFRNLCVTLNEGYGPEKALESELGTDEQKAQRSIATNPFDYYTRKTAEDTTIIEEALSRAGKNTLCFFNEEGEVVAVVTSAPFTLDGNDLTYNGSNYSKDKICLILSTSNVTVQTDFRGLIMAQGDVIVNATTGIVTLTASSEDVNAAMGAKSSENRSDFKNASDEYDLFEVNEDDKPLDSGIMPYEFLYYNYIPAHSEDDSNSGSYWDVGTLVYYDGWYKESGIGED